MSDTWSYDLFIPSRNVLESTELEDIHSILKDVGFSPINPVTGTVVLTRVDVRSLELINLDFKDLESISAYTGTDGSLLQIWKGDMDLFIGFSLKPALRGEFGINSKRENVPASQLSIMIDNTHFRKDTGKRNVISNDIRTLFLGFCEYFNAYYGCSYNEDSAETLFTDLNLWNAINLDGNPKKLFWLNYFSNELVSSIDVEEMISLGGKIVITKTGLIVFFSNNPWESTISFLRNLNNDWLRVLS